MCVYVCVWVGGWVGAVCGWGVCVCGCVCGGGGGGLQGQRLFGGVYSAVSRQVKGEEARKGPGRRGDGCCHSAPSDPRLGPHLLQRGDTGGQRGRQRAAV